MKEPNEVERIEELLIARATTGLDAASAAELDRRLADCGLETSWTGQRAQAWWQAHIPRAETPCDAATPEEQRAREEELHTIVEI